MDQHLNTTRKDIKNFKNNFNQNIGFEDYQKLLRELNTNYVRSSFNEDNWKIRQTEKQNLKKFVFKKYYDIYNNQAKRKEYFSALEVIEKLENKFNLDKICFPDDTKKVFKENIKKVKKNCHYFSIMERIDVQKKEKNYEDALNELNDLYNFYDMNNDKEILKSIKNNIKSTKLSYIKHVNEKNCELLYKKNYGNIDDIINEFEKINKKFEYEYETESKHLIREAKILYAQALKTKIELKESQNENCKQEKEKLKRLKDEGQLDDIDSYFNNKQKHNSSLENNNYQDDKENNGASESGSETFLRESVDRCFLGLNAENRENQEYNSLEKELKDDIYKQIEIYNEELLKLQDNKNLNFSEWKSEIKEIILNNNERGRVFAFFNLINRQLQKIKYDIRLIQLISILILSKKKKDNESKEKGGKFLQINTGEGKSLIIQFFASYLAIQGKKVDIVTSSSVLADKDADDINKINFYRKLELNVGKASQDQYDCDIIYGDTQNFEAGILRGEFKGKNVRNGRPFDFIIVDEVDSISLDNIITMTQLTDNFPGRSCFYFFYYQILLFYLSKEAELKRNNEKLEEKTEEIKKFMMEQFKKKYLNEDGTLKKDLILLYPNSMKNYIENTYETWIDNAIKATKLEEKKDFLKKDNEINPIDYSNTGEIQSNMVWDGGLQQFLQIIHDAKGLMKMKILTFYQIYLFLKDIMEIFSE